MRNWRQQSKREKAIEALVALNNCDFGFEENFIWRYLIQLFEDGASLKIASEELKSMFNANYNKLGLSSIIQGFHHSTTRSDFLSSLYPLFKLIMPNDIKFIDEAEYNKHRNKKLVNFKTYKIYKTSTVELALGLR